MLSRKETYNQIPDPFDPPRRFPLSHLLLFGLPGLLFLPVLYYSLATGFALVDDLGMCYYVEFLDNSKRFYRWFDKEVLNFSYGRYRPFFDLYNMVTWKLFGATPWLHHLARWVLHLGAIATFAAAFVCISRDRRAEHEVVPVIKKVTPILLPLSFLVYTWFFFPNSPASRLGPQEVNTVFFLALCNWMIARILVRQNGGTQWLPNLLTYSVLWIGYLGLSTSKEINIAVLLWILVFYTILLFRGISWQKIVGGLPLLFIFIFTLKRIYTASKNNFYGVEPITPELVRANADWLYRELFQKDVSEVITIVFIMLLALLLIRMVVRLIKRDIDPELLFLVFLLGQFGSLYLIICTSWAPVLRYWYILIPILSTLLAFSVKQILEYVRDYWSGIRTTVQVALASFIIYFIGCNYYNFLQQTIAQYSLRQAEAELISEVAHLSEQGEHVHILKIKGDPEAELVAHLIDYFRRFSKRFYGKTYPVDTAPPRETGVTSYLVTMHEQPGDLDIYMAIESQQYYPLLQLAYRVSALFQGKSPLLSRDAGVHPLDGYRWIIYRTTS